MRPQIGERQAAQLAVERWGLGAADDDWAVCRLDGYDDTNLRLMDAAGATSYVLKAHNAGDSDPAEEYAEAQSALLAALQDSAVPVPAPLPLRAPAELSTDGYVLRVPGADGRVHAVRLLSWLPGTLLVDAPQSLELYRQLGALLGRMNRWLQVRRWDWRRTGALRRPRFEWNVQHLPATFARVRPSLLALPSMDVPLLDSVVAHLEAATAAAGSGLRVALIHSDANERNVLVDAAAAAAAAAQEQAARAGPAAGGAPSPPLIAGLLDWGDASWQWLASEAANAAAYMMLLDANAADPLPAAAALVAGYESELPLLPAERGLLRALCMARLAQSLALGAAAAAQQPDNTAYLLGTQRNGWRLLRTLWSLPDDAFLAALGDPPPPAPPQAGE